MNKKLIIGIVVAIAVAGGVVLAMNSSNKDETSSTASTANQNTASSTTPTGTDFTINANDTSADIESVSVKKGDTIKVTFKVDQSGVYHGGLQFKSDVVSSEGIAPGQSGTVTFVADKSFNFTPYWFQGQVKKDYLISVKVQ